MENEKYEKDADGTIWKILDYHTIHGTIDGMNGDRESRDNEARLGDKEFFGRRLRLPKGYGLGSIESVVINKDLILLDVNAEYHDDVKLPADENMVKVRILLTGGVKSMAGRINLEGTGAFVEAYPGGTKTEYVVVGEAPVRLLVLNCSPEYFTDNLMLTKEDLPDPLNQVYAKAGSRSKKGIVPLGPDVLRAANDMINGADRFPPKLRRQYLAAKCREIICAVINDLYQSSDNREFQSRFSIRDLNRVHEARDIIMDNFQNPPSIPKLATQVGLNQTKLKSLFKATFGVTINDLTQKCRMDRAVELLTTTDLGVAEVAYAVGYEYPANFSNAFRRALGHTPKQLRRAARGE